MMGGASEILQEKDTSHSNQHVCVRAARLSGRARCWRWRWLFGNKIPVSLQNERVWG